MGEKHCIDIDDVPLATTMMTNPDSTILQMFRLKGTVIMTIWWKILIMMVYTIFVLCLHNFVDGLRMSFPLSLVPVLGVVTGLLLVFRTNTAYDRYWEGRRLWSQLTYQIRSLTMSIWVGIDDQDKPDDIIEKTSAINLLIAFVFATKNYLRGEYAYDEPDMADLISHLPKFQTPSSNKPLSSQGSLYGGQGQGQGQGQGGCQNSGIANANANANGSTTILFRLDSKIDSAATKKPPPPPKRAYSLKAYDHVTPSNIPLEVIYYLFAYIKGVAKKGQCEANVMRNMQGAVLSLMDCLTGFERILRTPMPLAYRLHLVSVTWLYLLSLPYQLAGSLNWFALPAVTLASFALLGILGIGGEIENPFGYDDNDLPLDDFCKVIRREILVIVAHPMRHLSLGSWVMSTENHPFAPASFLSAPELVTKTGDELRQLLARGTQVIDSSHL